MIMQADGCFELDTARPGGMDVGTRWSQTWLDCVKKDMKICGLSGKDAPVWNG